MSPDRRPGYQESVQAITGVIRSPEYFRNRYMIYENVDPKTEGEQVVFADWLRSQLKKGGYRFRAAADLTGVDHSTLSRLALGQITPLLSTAAKVIDGLKVGEDEAYELVMGLVPPQVRDGKIQRLVHLPNSPVLSGHLAEQLRGYRRIRGLSVRGVELAIGGDHSSVVRREQDRVPMLDQYAGMAYAYGLNARQNAGILEAARLARP